jgi:DNA-binding response OmpR family regulator
MSQPILVVDDEFNFRDLVSAYLQKAGYQVVTADSGEKALQAFEQHQPALVILDVMLPDLDGWEVCRQLRARSNVPVLMLTGLSEEIDQISGFTAGADDYVIKPSSPRQIVARVKAMLRRTGYDTAELNYGPIKLSLGTHQVTLDDQIIPLTQHEFALLETLLRQPGRIFTRAELLSFCWESGYTGVDRVVDVHISSLRRKLGDAGELIVAVRGVGYGLDQKHAKRSG